MRDPNSHGIRKPTKPKTRSWLDVFKLLSVAHQRNLVCPHTIPLTTPARPIPYARADVGSISRVMSSSLSSARSQTTTAV